MPPGIGTRSDAYRSRYKYIQYLSDLFWNKWIKMYLPTLNIRSKWKVPVRNLQVGELVLINEPNVPRRIWPLAIVEEVHTSKDGFVRSAILKTRVNKIHRPITQIIPLEVDILD